MEFVRDLLGLQGPRTLAEIVREQRDGLRRACTDLDLECRQLDRDEKRLEPRIRERAERGKMREVRALARQLVQLERSRERLITVQSRLQGAATRLASVQSQQQMTQALGTAVRAMRMVRAGAPGQPSLQRVLRALAKEEFMADALEQLMDEEMQDEDAEEDEDALVGSVLARLEIDVADDLDGVALPAATAPASGGGGSTAADRARTARIARLEQPARLEPVASGEES